MIVKTFKYAIHSSKRLCLASRLSRAQSRDLNHAHDRHSFRKDVTIFEDSGHNKR